MKRLINVLCLSTLFTYYSWSQQLVLRGDYPDPSVVKIGDTYWATATTSNWAPAYPILKSNDLKSWQTISHVFPTLPQWADYYFWAPEISYDNGKVYVYYAAHKKGGNLCLGIASADNPEGPYIDHGPIMCQEVGSIDAFPIRDTDGKLYMVWKEDANSVGKPTSIWAMEMKEDRTGLVGEKKELFRNTEPWEGNLVEGVSMAHHGDYIYAFYAGNGCCGAACTYATGVARSKTLFGPWEKYPGNPILTGENEWFCPGHGTPVEKDGKHYFLYHAYHKSSKIYTGRQGLLIEYIITPDGWIEFVKSPAAQQDVPVFNSTFDFINEKMSNYWQWSVFGKPEFTFKGGSLYLSASPVYPGSFIGHKTITANYIATASVVTQKATAAGGIGLIGDERNVLALYYDKGKLQIVQIKDGKDSTLLSRKISDTKKLTLGVQVKEGKNITFVYSLADEKLIKLNKKPINGKYLPPWDRAVRVGLLAKGDSTKTAVFENFELKNN